MKAVKFTVTSFGTFWNFRNTENISTISLVCRNLRETKANFKNKK